MISFVRSIAAGLFYFLLDQKVTKNQVSEKASLPSRPLPSKPGKTWYAKVPRLCYAPQFLRFSETCFSPATALPRIVLPGFGRSCSADGFI
jgi:hypothetical protein